MNKKAGQTQSRTVDEHEFIDSTGRFDVSLWRKVTGSIGASVAPGISVLSPFGFEFIGDEKFLYHTLRRFYIYIGVPESSNLDNAQVGAEYCAKLLELLKKDYPKFYRSLGYVVNPLSRSSLHSDGTRLIYVANPVTTDSILDYYASYILYIPQGVVNNELRERVDFDHSIPSRRYLFQRSIMLASLFPSCAPNEADIKSIFQFIRDQSRQPISVDRVKESCTAEEYRLLDGAIIPMMKKIMDILAQPTATDDEIAEYHCRDIHSQKILTIKVRPSRFEAIKKDLIKTYQNYGKSSQQKSA